MRSAFIIVFLSSILHSYPLFGQDVILLAEPSAESMKLRWLPVDPQIWEAGRIYGYTLKRTSSEGETIQLAGKIFTQDSSFFAIEDHNESALLNEVGKMVYAADFLDPDSIKHQQILPVWYNYLVNEAENSQVVALGLGLGYVDVSYRPDRSYVYQLRIIDFSDSTLYQAGVSVPTGSLDIIREPNVYLQYEFPDGKSLHDDIYTGRPIDMIPVIAKASGDSIQLRWAPSNPVLWRRLHQDGVVLYRKTLSGYGDAEEEGWIAITDTIRPWDADRVRRSESMLDSMTLLAAELVYGELTEDAKTGLGGPMADGQMRFGFALLAADRSPQAADFLGLRFVDHDVKDGQTYQYKIRTKAINGPSFSFVEVKNERSEADVIQMPAVKSLDHVVQVGWSILNSNQFSYYQIERMNDDGLSWKPLHDEPILYLNDKENAGDGFYYFLDSVPLNYHEYTYRLSGLDAFGQWSTPVMISGQGIDLTPPNTPRFTSGVTTPDEKISLAWDQENPDGNIDESRLYLNFGTLGDQTREAISSWLPGSQSNYEYVLSRNASQTAYTFFVEVRDTAGNISISMPMTVYVVDDHPPLPPVGFRGGIDSSGVVTLVWNHNQEPDLIGYRVYYGNRADGEYSNLTPRPIRINAFFDTVTLNTLSEKIYYRVAAEDHVGNISDLSEVLALHRPDMVPPNAPVLLPSSSSGHAVILHWIPASSRDVEKQFIYRRDFESESSEWDLIAQINSPSDSLFADTTSNVEQVYQYALKAQDDAGLQSAYSNVVNGRRYFDGEIELIENLGAEFHEDEGAVIISWTIVDQIDAYFKEKQAYLLVYRSTRDSDWRKIQQLPVESLMYEDRSIKEVGAYSYAVKVVYEDGKVSALSAGVDVEVKTNGQK